MGGVQSGTHNLGDALWVHERQKQRCHRENSRYEAQTSQNSQKRRKLLKRTRSLAVISEDESRQERNGTRHLQLVDPGFDLPRRHQLIPRAKLIDRNSLKDRLSKSQQHLSDSYDGFLETRSYQWRSTCGLHAIQPTFASVHENLPCPRTSRPDPDRLNILDWPDPPRRYRSVQVLESVSGLVDIVEDNWPIEGNRSIDCIYTQVKRKRKEHRSLDSILFEDEGELEYFDVLNLLPLSNVRLEFDEKDTENSNVARKQSRDRKNSQLKAIEYRKDSPVEGATSDNSNATDEEKCKSHTSKEDPLKQAEKNTVKEDSNCLEATEESNDPSKSSQLEEVKLTREDSKSKEVGSLTFSNEENVLTINIVEDEPGITNCDQEVDRNIEEAEDYKSIWISDSEDQEDMSRRPQVLKIIDNDVTKCKPKNYCANNHLPADELANRKEFKNTSCNQSDEDDKRSVNYKPVSVDATRNLMNRCIDEKYMSETEDGSQSEERAYVKIAKSFFEQKCKRSESSRRMDNEGRFEGIIKEPSSNSDIRSDSSDLGLGSETGSDLRRRSMDDGIEEDQSGSGDGRSLTIPSDMKKHSNLTRSRSCVDSIEFQETGPEFDHVRYKIVKSNVFRNNIYSSGKRGDVPFDELVKYLREYSFQELLLGNNVVIIEPVRAEPVETRQTTKKRNESSCNIAGAIQKRSSFQNKDSGCEKNENERSLKPKSPKQSSIRKHFFYHPIRVNRELIDDELPDPDTVRNVRQMFEETLKKKNNSNLNSSQDFKDRKSVSMKNLCGIDDNQYDCDKSCEISRSRSSSRAKDLTRHFECMDKSLSPKGGLKDDLDSSRVESKTRILAQSFEARSGQTSPSDSNSTKNNINQCHRQHHHNWDSGSVSSGVSSDYPDTDAGSGTHCISSEDEEVDCQYDDGVHGQEHGHFVSQDVLKKIREYGTSVTYYGGKVVNASNAPLISPLIGSRFERFGRSSDYVKFRLVKSNSCDSRLELTGRVIDERARDVNCHERISDLCKCTIAETPSIEFASVDSKDETKREECTRESGVVKRELPVVIGLEPKKDDGRSFKPEFIVGHPEKSRTTYPNRFVDSALNKWQVNSGSWKTGNEFGKMEFEEFEVLEDSLNGLDSDNQRVEAS